MQNKEQQESIAFSQWLSMKGYNRMTPVAISYGGKRKSDAQDK